MPRPLRPHLFHIYVPEKQHFGCPEAMYTRSWVVRLDSADRILPEWVCPTCLRSIGLAANPQARRNRLRIDESSKETPPGAHQMKSPSMDRFRPML